MHMQIVGISVGNDLKIIPPSALIFLWRAMAARMRHELRSHCVCATDRVSVPQRVQKCVARYGGDRYAKKLSCWEQYLAMAFAQLTYRESLRDIEACLGAVGGKLYHMGFGSGLAPSTLADANENRDWRIYADFAHTLIATARLLYAVEAMGVDLDSSLYALDSTTIDLCLSLFPWAKFRQYKGAVKMHTLLDLHGNIPAFLRITDGKVHDVNILDEILPEAGSFYVMDRGYVDFKRLYAFTLSSAFFVVRSKKNVLLQRRYSHPVDKSTGVRSDHTVILTALGSASAYPDPLRRVTYCDPETGKRLKFLTNNFTLPALTIAQITVAFTHQNDTTSYRPPCQARNQDA